MLAVWLYGCFFLRGDNLEQDLDKMCKIATRIDAETDVEPGKRLDKLARRVAEERGGPGAVALITAIQKAPPAARQKVLDEVLERNGIDGLDCPPLERILVGERAAE
ncbi:MAG: hypothetical protein ABMB14_06610 [Myxococcota bacterium]